MAQNITFNGQTYIIPNVGDVGWGANLDDYFIAISDQTLQPSGGNFTLTSDVNFGPNYGLIAPYFTGYGGLPAQTGSVRLGNGETIAWRNNTNTADVSISVDSNNRLVISPNTNRILLNGTTIRSDGVNEYEFSLPGDAGLPGQLLTSQGGSRMSWSDPSSYTLPTASLNTLGGVKIDGTSITIDGNGTISSNASGSGTTLNLTTTGTSGASTLVGNPEDGYTLNVPQYTGGGGGAVQSVTGNIVSGTTANPVVTQVQPDWNASTGLGTILNKPSIPAPYTLPTATSLVLGGVKIGTGITSQADGTISTVYPDIPNQVTGYQYQKILVVPASAATQYGGTIANATPDPTSGRQAYSNWTGATIPNVAGNANIQTINMTLFSGSVSPMIGSKIFPDVAFRTAYTGSLNLNTNASISVYCRITMTTTHALTPSVVTSRAIVTKSTVSGLFDTVDLSSFNSDTVLPPNPATADGSYDGTIGISVALKLEFFQNVADAYNVNNIPPPGTISSNTTINFFTLRSAAVTYIQSASSLATAGVASFNGRSGIVLPVANDYSFSQLSGSATASQLPTATSSALGILRPDGTTITINNGVISGANTYSLPTATSAILGGVKIGNNVNVAADGTISVAFPTQVQTDWNQTTTTAVDYIKNKPTIPAAQVNSDWNATSGVAQILNKPTIPAQVNITGNIVSGTYPNIAIAQVQPDWNASTGLGTILNKPTIPAAQVNSDWNATSGVAQILNKPTIPSPYTLPTATSTVLGGVKIGSGVTVAADGTISVSGGGGSSVQVNGNVVNNPNFTSSLTQLLTVAQIGGGSAIFHTIDSSGTIVISAYNTGIWQRTSAGVVTQLLTRAQIGNGTAYFHTIDSSGTLVVSADTGGVWQRTSAGVVTQLLATAQIGEGYPRFHTIDSAGTLVVSTDDGVYQRTSAGVITHPLTLAQIGNGTANFHTIDSAGTLVVSATTGVWQRTSAGVVTQLLTLAQIGNGTAYFHTIDSSGTLVVSAFGTGVWQRTSAGVVTQLLNVGSAQARFHTIDASGTLVVSFGAGGVYQRTSAGVSTQLLTSAQIGGGAAYFHSIDASGTLVVSAATGGIYQRVSVASNITFTASGSNVTANTNIASTGSVGVVKIGSGINVQADGTISSAGSSVQVNGILRSIVNLVSTTSTSTAVNNVNIGATYCHTSDSTGANFYISGAGGFFSSTISTAYITAATLGGAAKWHTVDSSGNFIISADTGGLWRWTSADGATRIATTAQMGNGTANFHTVDSAGTIVISTVTAGLYQRTSAGVVSQLVSAAQVANDYIYRHYVDASGNITMTGYYGIYRRTTGGVVSTLVSYTQIGSGVPAYNSFNSANNTLTISASTGVWQQVGGSVTQLVTSAQLGNLGANYHSFDAFGNLIISAQAGIYKRTPAGVVTQIVSSASIVAGAEPIYHILSPAGSLTVSTQVSRIFRANLTNIQFTFDPSNNAITAYYTP